MRQWYAVRRLDKALLPPAQAMLDFLGEEGFRHLPTSSLPHARQPVGAPGA
jgi:LysR family transcriptional regulator, low CO2-responsive transcriptional regulator